MLNAKPLTKTAILSAVKSAIKASLATNGKPVKVALPGWEQYELHAVKAYVSRVQQYPSTVVRVRHAMKMCAWDTTASHLDTLASRMAKRAKEHGGWCGPVDVDYIPVSHPAFNFGEAKTTANDA